jgi:hypothetical protein
MLKNILRPYFTSFRNKLECLSLANFPAFSNKHSSLVQKFVNCGLEKFYNMDPWTRSYKQFVVVPYNKSTIR